jgi:16S rRNA (guanine527-N7)-methyltransferase
MIVTANLPALEQIWQQTTGWKPNPSQQQLLQQLYSQILQVNQHLNLTRITAPQEFWEKHLWDSLAPVLSLNLANLKVIDIGTGAGFPGIPVAIAFPQSQVTLLDSTRKKINFLDSLINSLNLNNVNTLIGRVEAIGQDKNYRASYDLALIRAVAQAPVCAEYALPLLKIGELAILYRGHWSEKETDLLFPPLDKLGGKIKNIKKLNTPLTQSIRHYIYLKKIKPTPDKFPRPAGQPSRHPL